MAKQKDLDKEGITIDFLNTINSKNLGNPVQLLPNDEPVKLLKCSTGYWVSVDSEIVKDEKNNYIVVSNQEALIARARYLLNFSEDVKLDKIKNEVIRLKKLVDNELFFVLDKLRWIMYCSGHLNPFRLAEAIAFSAMKQEMRYQEKKEQAEKMVTVGLIEFYKRLDEQQDAGVNKDYDSLYILLIKNGQFEIASFNSQSDKEVQALIRNFHASKIVSTIDEIKGNSHIENVAKFNIEKQS